jgi:hypothetical protein
MVFKLNIGLKHKKLPIKIEPGRLYLTKCPSGKNGQR